jgi:ribose 5-phosphate isomerase A
MTIVERAMQLVTDGSRIGLGSGRAARAFVEALGNGVRNGLQDQGVATSKETAALARREGIPLLALDEAGLLEATFDGADEVDPNLDLLKGYGRALVREKIDAASSQRLFILVGEEKLVPQLGTRGRLPVEVLPFAVPLCERRLSELGCRPVIRISESTTIVPLVLQEKDPTDEDDEKQPEERFANRPAFPIGQRAVQRLHQRVRQGALERRRRSAVA